MATFRNGDRVTVKAEVISDPYDFDGTQKVKLRVEPYHDIFVPVSDLTMDRPDIRVGDAVEWTVGEKAYSGEVLATVDDHAWVHLGGGEYATVWLSNATRVDVAPIEEAA